MNSSSVLLVDDDPVSLALLEEHLRSKNYHVLSASSVSQAMICLKKHRIQIVIADWVMPGMNGLDLCRWLRWQKFDHPIYFVMLTIHSEQARLVEAFEAGVDDFLSKPLDEGELTARLRAWSRFIHLQDDLAKQHQAAQQLNEELATANEQLAVANAKLAEMALLDDLTSLPNRREAMRRLEEQWAIARRYGLPLSCAMIDVDHFKEFNDSYGHAVGDSVLVAVAKTLRDTVRAADFVFRIGGDEFLALFPATTAFDAQVITGRFEETLSRQVIQNGDQQISCRASTGVAELAATMQSQTELVRSADSALYASKRRDKACASAG